MSNESQAEGGCPLTTRHSSLPTIRRSSSRLAWSVSKWTDDWEFCGTTAEKYAQVGNAVPVRLATLAGQVIAEQLDQLRQRAWEPYTARPAAYRIRYIQSHVRTRVWYKDGQMVVWADGQPNKHASYKAPRTKRKDTDMAQGSGR